VRFKGQLSRSFLWHTYMVDFHMENSLLAKLKLGYKERRKDVYELLSSENGPSFSPITISLSGLFTKNYKIQSSESKTVWFYKRKRKWYEFFNNESILETDEGVYDIEESNEKFQVYRSGEWIGTVKKVYGSLFDKGEYDVSFDSQNNLTPFLILASVLAIETEVLSRRDG
jgi:hypothetical protein